MIYLDIVVTDTENAIEYMPVLDHKGNAIKDALPKNRVTLWTLIKLKYNIDALCRAIRKSNGELTITKEVYVQSDTNNESEEAQPTS